MSHETENKNEKLEKIHGKNSVHGHKEHTAEVFPLLFSVLLSIPFTYTTDRVAKIGKQWDKHLMVRVHHRSCLTLRQAQSTKAFSTSLLASHCEIDWQRVSNVFFLLWSFSLVSYWFSRLRLSFKCRFIIRYNFSFCGSVEREGKSPVKHTVELTQLVSFSRLSTRIKLFAE